MHKKTAHPVAVCITSLGCAKNLVDTEVMAGVLAQAGFALTSDPAAARVMLINTCSFIADARTEAESEIGRALAWKKSSPRTRKLVVAGCLPQRERPLLRERHPEIDLLIGLDDVPKIADHLARLFRGDAAPAAAGNLPLPDFLYDENTPRLLLTPATFAYVKIAEGCDHGCRFCAIPGIRGRQRSRSIASVVKECRNLLGMGVKELNLIAQDSTSYGRDRRDGATLAALLRELDALEAPGPFWIRVLYIHPRHTTGELLETMAAARHVVPYLDMPLQHISDHVLRDMGRGMGEAETRALCDRIRRRLPDAVFRTTFLVGYPGETEADFNTLLEFVRAFRFDRLGVFAYSPEAGTPAAAVTENLVPAAVAEARRARLMEEQQVIALEKNRALVGATLTILFEHADSARRWTGRTAGDAPEVDNVVRVVATPPRTPGFAEVRITAAAPYELTAKPA